MIMKRVSSQSEVIRAILLGGQSMLWGQRTCSTQAVPRPGKRASMQAMSTAFLQLPPGFDSFAEVAMNFVPIDWAAASICTNRWQAAHVSSVPASPFPRRIEEPHQSKGVWANQLCTHGGSPWLGRQNPGGSRRGRSLSWSRPAGTWRSGTLLLPWAATARHRPPTKPPSETPSPPPFTHHVLDGGSQQ